MAVVRFRAENATPRVGVRRGSDIVPVDSLDAGGGVNEVIDSISSVQTLESQAEDALTNDPEVDVHPVSQVEICLPVNPTKIVRIEGSYEHDLVDEDYNPFIDTVGLRERDWPRFWVAPTSAMAPASEPLVLPKFAETVKPSVELALVVGASGKHWSLEEATEAIAGCIAMVDIGIYDPLPGQWGYKFFDSAMTFGTDLVSSHELDVCSLDLSIELNGSVVDTKSTEGWRFSPKEMVSTVSEIMSIRSGDIITTGNPMRIERTVDPGDELRATIENVGTVKTSIRRERTDAEVLI
jgi:2-keto-4-pentenoate hydratase/2-oxohepta-3-ene-1,7-dioic acid hydratase in catechol pathway